MAEVVPQEPHMIIEGSLADDLLAVRLSAAIRERPEDILRAVMTSGRTLLSEDWDNLSIGPPELADTQLVDTVFATSTDTIIDYDDATEGSLLQDPRHQSLIARLRELKGKQIIADRRVIGREDHPEAIALRDTIRRRRLGTLVIRRLVWNSQTADEEGLQQAS